MTTLSLHPVSTACADARYDCGHITRSDSTAVKRALFLFLAESEGLGYLGSRTEATEVLAALVLMRQGAECARIIAAATDTEVAEMAAEVAPLPALTTKQIEVLALVAEGLSFPEIAATLSKSVETVRSLTKAAMRATMTHSVVQAAVEAARDGLI